MPFPGSAGRPTYNPYYEMPPAACAAFRHGLLAVSAAVCALALLHASDDLTLAAKARLFEVDLAERFLAADG